MHIIFEKYKWLKYVLGGLIIALGVTVIILAALSVKNVGVVVNIVVASGLIVLGILLLVTALLSETHKPMTLSLVISSLLITLGILLLIMRFHLHIALLDAVTVYILSLFLLVFGTVALIKAITLIIYKQRVIFIVLLFVFATLGITAGILGLCFANKLVPVIYILLGTILVAIGAVVIAVKSIIIKS